jgi:general secretion pathway protein I
MNSSGRRMVGPPPARGRLRSARREAGFTLIEIVVAFVLLALVLSTTFELFSAGLRRAGELEDQSRAILIAQSKIAATGMEQPLAEGSVQGETEDGRFHWTVSVKPSAEGQPPPDQPQPGPGTFMLYRVDVRVEWTGGDQRPRSYSLATLGMGSRT